MEGRGENILPPFMSEAPQFMDKSRTGKIELA
jgi:hypothetical protein